MKYLFIAIPNISTTSAKCIQMFVKDNINEKAYILRNSGVRPFPHQCGISGKIHPMENKIYTTSMLTISMMTSVHLLFYKSILIGPKHIRLCLK